MSKQYAITMILLMMAAFMTCALEINRMSGKVDAMNQRIEKLEGK